ncbi:MAG: hypothetical protein ABI528_04080 [bacterium]
MAPLIAVDNSSDKLCSDINAKQNNHFGRNDILVNNDLVYFSLKSLTDTFRTFVKDTSWIYQNGSDIING